MSYTALPDRRMPYHRDGTVAGYSTAAAYATDDIALAAGLSGWLTGNNMIELNDGDYVVVDASFNQTTSTRRAWYMFFPEVREVTAMATGYANYNWDGAPTDGVTRLEGSSDSTSGVDGTFEVASWPGGQGYGHAASLDGWRRHIKAISLTGGKSVVRWVTRRTSVHDLNQVLVHLYGEKYAGQTPDDLIFINHDDTPGVEYTAPEDFGDRPLGTTVTRQFRVKNDSPTLTANSINLQCNDSDFAISTDNSTWVTTINISSLAAGAESSTMYVRCTTPSPGALLGPRFAEIVAVVGSWS